MAKVVHRYVLPGVILIIAIFLGRQWLNVLPGPPWASGLSEAAEYISLYSGPNAGIVANGQPIIDLADRFSRGEPCERSTQIVGYLDRNKRGQVLCDRGGRIDTSGHDEIWYVHEPIAWIGNRRVVFDDLLLLSEPVLGETRVEVYTNHLPENELKVDDRNTIMVPEHDQGTLVMALSVPDGIDPGRVPEDLMILGAEAGFGMHGTGFALYHLKSWVDQKYPPLFALAFSHDGRGAQNGVRGRGESYLFEPLGIYGSTKAPVALVGVSWKKESGRVLFRVGTGKNLHTRNWSNLLVPYRDLGGAMNLSVPQGVMTSSFDIRHAFFTPVYMEDMNDRDLRFFRILAEDARTSPRRKS